MPNVYVSSVANTAIAQWAASHAYSLGAYVRQLATPTYGNERVFKCTTAGTSGASEPTWALGNNNTTTSGTAVFTQVGGQEAEQVAGNWRAALANMTAAQNLNAGNGTVFFVSDDHVEERAGANGFFISAAGTMLCVSRTGATIPPTAADDSSGASFGTSGSSADLTIGTVYARGCTFNCGNGSNGAWLSVAAGTGGDTTMENCTLNMRSTASGGKFRISSNATIVGGARLINCTFNFTQTDQTIVPTSLSNFEMVGGTFTGSVPTNLFTPEAPRLILLRNVDFSPINTSLFYSGYAHSHVRMVNCQLNASVTDINFAVADNLSSLTMNNCDNSTSGSNYHVRHIFIFGTIDTDTVAATVGGASDGVTTYSHKYTVQPHSGASPDPSRPMYGSWYERRYNTTGASKTLTMEVILFRTTAATDLNLWLEVEALTDAGVPIGEVISTRNSWPFGAGTSLTTTSTLDWTGGSVAARQNSHAYSVGDLVKLASNPGRLFRCTTAGTSAASEPAGYATATGGTDITDGGAHFLVGRRYKLTATFTPQMAGMVQARVCAAMTSGVIFYVDPKLYIA